MMTAHGPLRSDTSGARDECGEYIQEETPHIMLRPSATDDESGGPITPWQDEPSEAVMMGRTGTVTKPLAVREAAVNQVSSVPEIGPLDCCAGD